MTTTQILSTFEEYERIVMENPDRPLELINGEIIEKMPTEEHGEIVLNLGSELRAYAKKHKLGRVTTEARHRIQDDMHNARLPDISFIAGERPSVKKGSIPRMPDLAVEVKSPDDTMPSLREKAEYYLKNGTRLVFLVIPERREIEVCTPGADGTMGIKTLSEEDSLDGGDVLPGFSMAVKDVFDLG